MARDSREFRDRHLEAAIAHDREDQLVRAGELRPDRGGESEAHRAEPAGVDPEARLVETNELSGPHLMLSDVRGDDRAAAREAVDLAHQVLRLDFRVGSRNFERVLGLPLADLVPPGAARRAKCFGYRLGGLFQKLDELAEDALDVSHDRDIGSADLADFGRV